MCFNTSCSSLLMLHSCRRIFRSCPLIFARVCMIVSKIDMHVSRILQVNSPRPRCLAQSLRNVNFFRSSEMLAGAGFLKCCKFRAFSIFIQLARLTSFQHFPHDRS